MTEVGRVVPNQKRRRARPFTAGMANVAEARSDRAACAFCSLWKEFAPRRGSRYYDDLQHAPWKGPPPRDEWHNILSTPCAAQFLHTRARTERSGSAAHEAAMLPSDPWDEALYRAAAARFERDRRAASGKARRRREE